MGHLRILTMNCLGLPVPIPGLRRRLRALGSALAASEVDLACLQEVGRWSHLPSVRGDETTWPFAIAQQYPYAPKGGLLTLSRVEVNTAKYFTFQERGRAASLQAAERLQGKGVLQITLQIERQAVIVLNTHLAANYLARWSYDNLYAKVERAQLAEISAIVRAIPPDILVIIAGDFNVPRASWLYREFVQQTGLHDPLGASTSPTYRPMAGMPARAAQALDHIFVRAPSHLTLDATSELCFADPVRLAHGAQGYLSDHLGVRLDLRW